MWSCMHVCMCKYACICIYMHVCVMLVCLLYVLCMSRLRMFVLCLYCVCVHDSMTMYMSSNYVYLHSSTSNQVSLFHVYLSTSPFYSPTQYPSYPSYPSHFNRGRAASLRLAAPIWCAQASMSPATASLKVRLIPHEAQIIEQSNPFRFLSFKFTAKVNSFVSRKWIFSST